MSTIFLSVLILIFLCSFCHLKKNVPLEHYFLQRMKSTIGKMLTSFFEGPGGHFAGMPKVADRKVVGPIVGVKNRKRMPMS